MTAFAVALAVAGATFGFLADRLAARWPAHEPGTPKRGLDWRTAAVTVTGGLAFGGLALRWTDPAALLLLGGWFAALLVLLATDLDQKLLPDVVTLPLIPIAAVALWLGLDPLLAGKDLGVMSGVAAAIGAPLLLFITDLLLRGALGMGDLKLAVSIGLLSGVSRTFAGFLLATAASSVLLVALIATRRIGLKSAIPFGPILVAGAFVGALLP